MVTNILGVTAPSIASEAVPNQAVTEAANRLASEKRTSQEAVTVNLSQNAAALITQTGGEIAAAPANQKAQDSKLDEKRKNSSDKKKLDSQKESSDELTETADGASPSSSLSGHYSDDASSLLATVNSSSYAGSSLSDRSSAVKSSNIAAYNSASRLYPGYLVDTEAS